MCRNQLVRSTGGTVSFSVLGVAVILGVGGFIVLLSFVLEALVGWAQGRWWKRRQLWRREAWRRDEALQVQRALFEQMGWGRWVEGAEEMAVPVCEAGERFGGASGGDIGREKVGGRGTGAPEEVGLMGDGAGTKDGAGAGGMGLAKVESRVVEIRREKGRMGGVVEGGGGGAESE